MAEFRVFTGYSTTALGGFENMSSGQTFTMSGGQPSGVAALSVILSDGAGDIIIQGDRNTQENQDDVGGDQRAFISTAGGTVLVDGGGVYLEQTFTFTVDGLGPFTAYQFEVEGTGEDFVIFPPGIPDGNATVTGNDFTPGSGAGAGAGQDNVSMAELSDGPEGADSSDYSNFTTFTAGADSMIGGSGNDVLFGGNGNDTIEGGGGNDRLVGQNGNDVLIGGEGNDTLEGGANNDTLTGGAGDDSLVGGGGADNLDGGDGSDTLFGNGGNDVITGGAGGDTIDGGDGADTIYGDLPPPVREKFSWADADDPDDATTIDDEDAIGTQTVNNGNMSVDITVINRGSLAAATFESTDVIYTGGISDDGGGVSGTSAIALDGSGATADIADLEIEFNANSAAFSDNVANVSFNIVDIDTNGSFVDVVQIQAFNAAGDAVTISITPGSALTPTDSDTVPGNDFVSGAGTGVANDDDASNSITVDITGPVSRIVINYLNEGSAFQSISVSDIYYDLLLDESGGYDDVIDGGAGNDVIDAQQGDDTITVAQNDTVTGGVGADVFVITDADASNILITDFDVVNGITDSDLAADQNDNDFADLSGFFANLKEMRAANLSADGVDVVLDLGGGQTLTFAGVTDDNDLTFENVNLVCFTRNTLITTPTGTRAVQDLREGDIVITLDNGPQAIRWIGSRLVPAIGRFAAIRIDTGHLGNTTPLLVSPQHRMLVRDEMAELLFGVSEIFVPAINLVDDKAVTVQEGGYQEYFHFLFDTHQIVFANGAPAESMHPGQIALDGFGKASRDEILELFPDLETSTKGNVKAARTTIRSSEMRVLANQRGVKLTQAPQIKKRTKSYVG